ncbi:hypothetical protein ACHAWF_002664 [Thalassiosira exigua]
MILRPTAPDGEDASSSEEDDSADREDDGCEDIDNSAFAEGPPPPNGLAAGADDADVDDDDDPAARAVRKWAADVPVGMGLCPWAVRSLSRGILRVVACRSDEPGGAAKRLEDEVASLLREEAPPWSTALVVCPRVKAWEDFDAFDEFVRDQNRRHADDVTLVAFHPRFLRWRGLPSGVGVGCPVRSHWGTVGKKSATTASATVLETSGKAFGARKVKLRFDDDVDGLGRREQYVPADWIEVPPGAAGPGPPLPDNAMHRAPYPSIHVIANRDLAGLCLRDVSRVKRTNAQRMARLGWEGLERRRLEVGTAVKEAASDLV